MLLTTSTCLCIAIECQGPGYHCNSLWHLKVHKHIDYCGIKLGKIPAFLALRTLQWDFFSGAFVTTSFVWCNIKASFPVTLLVLIVTLFTLQSSRCFNSWITFLVQSGMSGTYFRSGKRSTCLQVVSFFQLNSCSLRLILLVCSSFVLNYHIYNNTAAPVLTPIVDSGVVEWGFCS